MDDNPSIWGESYLGEGIKRKSALTAIIKSIRLEQAESAMVRTKIVEYFRSSISSIPQFSITIQLNIHL
jgi:hypothetical protein